MTNEIIAFQGDYINVKHVLGRKVFNPIIDIPLEHYQDFIAKFGGPNPANPPKVAVVLLTEETASDEQPQEQGWVD